MLQTNGDLLTGEILDTLVQKGVTRIDLASIDRYHKNAGARLDVLKQLFFSRGFSDENTSPLIEKDTYLKKDKLHLVIGVPRKICGLVVTGQGAGQWKKITG